MNKSRVRNKHKQILITTHCTSFDQCVSNTKKGKTSTFLPRGHPTTVPIPVTKPPTIFMPLSATPPHEFTHPCLHAQDKAHLFLIHHNTLLK